MSKTEAKLQSFSSRVELITPELAGDWLALNTHNRKLSDARVRRFAAALLAGLWRLNGETIKFDRDGNLLDGQHRLAAVIFAKTSAEMIVVRGLPMNVFDTIDTGAPRRLADALYISGEESPAHLGAALLHLYRYRTAGVFARAPRTEPPLIQQLEELLQREPNIRQSVHDGYRLSRKVKIGTGLAAALCYLTAQIDEDQSATFWEGVRTGVDLAATSPIFRLRERLLSKGKLSLNEAGALSIKAWNLYRRGDRTKVLMWRPTQEPMPEPI